MNKEINKNAANNADKKKENGNSKSFSKSQVISLGAVFLLVIAGLALALFQTNDTTKLQSQQLDSLSMERQELANQLIVQDSIVNDWMLTLEQIESDLVKIQGKEQKLYLSDFDPENTPDIRETILSEIQSVNTLMDKNKSRIYSLRSQLKKSGMKITSLEERLLALELNIETRDSVITDLKNMLVEQDFQLAELNVVIDSLNTNLYKVEEEVTLTNAELNKAFIAKGNYKELRDKGIIDKEGGILGLGANKTINTKIDNNLYSQVGIKETDHIDVNAKKAKLITEHPAESYDIVENDSLIAYIDIKKPDEFWKITKYAVIETK